MILARPEIEAALKKGEIKIDPPIEEKQWGPASVDLRLGTRFARVKEAPGIIFSLANGISTIAASGLWAEKDLKEENEFEKRETFVLEPSEFILALTYERVTIPNNLIASVEGRSSYARFGLAMHQTAPWIDPGFIGPITLEIINSGKNKIELTPLKDRLCRLTFFQLTSALSDELKYGAKLTDVFQKQEHALVHKKS